MSGRTIKTGGTPQLTYEQIERARARKIIEIAEAYDIELIRRKDTYWALCCFHKEKTPSLSFNPEKNAFYCHGCGQGGYVIDFVKEHDDLEFVDAVLKLAGEDEPAPPPKPRRLVSTKRHEIRDGTGALKAIHLRKEYDDGKKSMPWLHPDGRPSKKGDEVIPEDLPLYGVHEIGDADEVLAVEGEKAQEVAKALGIVAIGTVTGASSTPGIEALKPLIGRRVVWWADYDDVGREHKDRTAARLIDLGQPTELIRDLVWSEASHKGDDIADFVAAGGTGDGVRAMMAAAEEWAPEPSGGLGSSEHRLVFRSMREVAESVSVDPEWIIHGYLARGAITEIDGKVKSAGKTTLITYACRAVLDGTPFLGRLTLATPVVYLTEQSPATFLQSARRADLLERDDFRVLFWHDTVGVDWPLIVAAARVEAKRIGSHLLVVDTLPQFAGVKGDAENDTGTALEAMRPLQEAAATDQLAIVMLRHDRKSGGDVGDSGRGSSAFSGAVDVVLQLRRPEGQSRPGVRVLSALSRYDETPEMLVIELTDAGYAALGDAEDVATQEARVSLLNACPTDEGAALKEPELMAAAGVKRTIGQDVLREYVAAGRIVRIGAGKRGDPYRYWQLSEESGKVSAAAPVVPAERNGHDRDSVEKVSAALKTGVPAERNQTLRAGVPPGPATVSSFTGPHPSFLSAATSTLGAAERNGYAADEDEDDASQPDLFDLPGPDDPDRWSYL